MCGRILLRLIKNKNLALKGYLYMLLMNFTIESDIFLQISVIKKYEEIKIPEYFRNTYKPKYKPIHFCCININMLSNSPKDRLKMKIFAL